MVIFSVCRKNYAQIKEMAGFARYNPREAACNTALAILAFGIFSGAFYTVKNGCHKLFMQKMVTVYENTSIASKEKSVLLGLSFFIGANLYNQHRLFKELENTKKMLTLQSRVQERAIALQECAITVQKCAIKHWEADKNLQAIINQIFPPQYEGGRQPENPVEEGGLPPQLIDARRKCDESKRALVSAEFDLRITRVELKLVTSGLLQS